MQLTGRSSLQGTTARKPTQPMTLIASASGCLRAIAMRPGRSRMTSRG